VRFQASALCLSWIPPEAVDGLFKLPFTAGVAHYDAPPPDASPDVDALLKADAIRFANEIRGSVEVEAGRVINYRMSGRGRVGSTTVRLSSHRMTFAAASLPETAEEPTVSDDGVTFVRTAGGHTGVPIPRAVPHAPFWRLTAPLAWSSLSLTIHLDGSSESRIVDASPFPRHYLYDTNGRLTHKTAMIRYRDWLRHADYDCNPWTGAKPPVPVTEVPSEVEHALAHSILMSRAGRQQHLPAGGRLSEAPISESEVQVLIDGILVIEIDGKPGIEVGPGAIFDPALRTAESKARVSVRAQTASRLAVMPRDQLDNQALIDVAAVQAARLGAYPATDNPQNQSR
jgi:hypothetical protein